MNVFSAHLDRLFPGSTQAACGLGSVFRFEVCETSYASVLCRLATAPLRKGSHPTIPRLIASVRDTIDVTLCASLDRAQV